jgi:hypothetical protein
VIGLWLLGCPQEAAQRQALESTAVEGNRQSLLVTLLQQNNVLKPIKQHV